MREIFNVNIFTIAHGRDNAICITTNGKIKKDGKAVMGRGIAKTANDYFSISDKLAKYLGLYGNRVFDMGLYRFNGCDPYHVITFPTKHDWRDDSDIELIKTSAEQLKVLCDKRGITTCYLPPVGCANGHLDYEKQVKPIIEGILDDRFIVILGYGQKKQTTYQDEHFDDMPYLTEKGREMERELKRLADQYGYKKLPQTLSLLQREYYMGELDDFWKNGEFKNHKFNLIVHDGSVIATGVTERGFVCGDYGVFLEIETSQINRENIKVQPGQEYRINNPRYAESVKYQWYTDKVGDGIKLYFQQKGVTYADYQPNLWYVSPYEVQVQIVD